MRDGSYAKRRSTSTRLTARNKTHDSANAFDIKGTNTLNNDNGLELDVVVTEQRGARSTLRTDNLAYQDSNFINSLNHATGRSSEDTLYLDDFESSNESFIQSLHDTKQADRFGSPISNATIDLMLAAASFLVLHFLYWGNLDFTSFRTIAVISSVSFVMIAMSIGGRYNNNKPRTLENELTSLLLCWISAFAAVGLFMYLTKSAEEVSRFWITSSMISTLVLLAGVRVLGSLGLIAASQTVRKNIVLCGDTPNLASVVNELYKLPNARIRISKLFELPTQSTDGNLASDKLQFCAKKIVHYIEEQRRSGKLVEQVWISVPADNSTVIEELTTTLINTSVDVCVVPDAFTLQLIRSDACRYGNMDVVNISEVALPPGADRFKRLFDICLTSIALLVLCIPMALIAILIKLETPGPALFRQKRYGVDGREIDIFKFRSMVVHADEHVKQATRNDPRVTRLGKILRSTSLDELPQLFNVMTGCMSLVGPRPHAVAHNEIWRNQITGYMLRHKVRPGITGWAQVNGWRGETDKAYKMQKRVMFDLDYIQNWTPWLDVKIIALTIINGFRNENAY